MRILILSTIAIGLLYGQAPNKSRERILELSLTRLGFATPTVTLEEGQLTVIVNNRTRRGKLGIQVEKNEAGRGPGGSNLITKIADSEKDKQSGQPWQEKLNLTAGDYIVKDPLTGSSMKIVVTPKK